MKSPQPIIAHFTRILLAGTAAIALTIAPAVGGERNIIVAQAKTDAAKPEDKKPDEKAAPKKVDADVKADAKADVKAQAKPAEPATRGEPPKAAANPAAKPDAKPDAKQADAPPAAAAQKAAPALVAKDTTKDATKDAAPKQAAPQQAAPQQAAPKSADTAPAKQDAPAAAPPKTAAPETKPADAPKSAAGQDANEKAAASDNPAAVAPPTKARTSNEFIQKKGERASAGFDDVRRQRREVRRDGRVFIQEPDRTIVRDGNRTIIRHNEATRFAIDARGVRVERSGGTTTTVVTRRNGVRIITTTDADGHLLRRVRQTPDGKSIVIIDNTFAGSQRGFFIDIAPPRVRGPRDRYIVEAGRARRERIYEVFLAPPVAPLQRRYTLAQVRYSEPLRNYMPRVDLDINFETGSWQLASDQIDELATIAEGIKRAVRRNPREVYLIEGHTDAVGSDIDNLSLSDRRAEAVAVALTTQFDVPPENLVTQGYGEEYLKVETDGPSQGNRRVAARRITPLIDQQVATR